MTYDVLEVKLLAPKGATRDYPFGPQVAVFKVIGKIFALVTRDNSPLQISLKCDPLEADLLRSMFEAIKPGYHLNKAHWNTVTLDGTIPKDLLFKMIDASYDLVVKGLSKAEKKQLAGEVSHV